MADLNAGQALCRERAECLGVKPSYTAIASRGERYWFVRIPGLGNPGEDALYTQARSVPEIEAMARDLIELWLGIPEDSFDVRTAFEKAPPL